MEKAFVNPAPDWRKDLGISKRLPMFLHEVVHACALIVFHKLALTSCRHDFQKPPEDYSLIWSILIFAHMAIRVYTHPVSPIDSKP